MKQPLALFIGVARKGEFESLKRHGIDVGVIIDTNWALRQPDVTQFAVVQYCDFNSADNGLLQIVEQIQQEWNITAILVTHEFYVLAGAEVTEYLQLPGITRATALLCNDKSLMHSRFAEALGPDATARYARIRSRQDLVEFAHSTGFPIVLKPANLAGSLFISLNTSMEELLQQYEQMEREIPQFFSNAGWHDGSVHIQAEEFLRGTTHSIDIIVDSEGNILPTPIVDELTGQECGWQDFHIFSRYLPTRLSNSAQEAAYNLARAGIAALEIRSSIAHVELISTAQGPKLLEIGVRPGGYRPELFTLSNQFDVIYPYYQVRSGQRVAADIVSQAGAAVAILSPGTHQRGILREVLHLDEIQRLPSYLYHEVKAQIGQRVGPSTRGFYAPLGIVLKSERPEVVYQDMETIQRWHNFFVIEEQ